MSWQVPAYEAHEFFPRRTRFCLCVPVLNEDGRLQKQLQKMQGHLDLADVIVADGGSTDGSTEPSSLRDSGVRGLLVKTGPGRL
ncbi:MAG TPA: glycosyltransferase family 2 protein, partial [Myxococcales bacterium]|nr:glycosyltransferase family 2 protein [Myxococcales bacterium]